MSVAAETRERVLIVSPVRNEEEHVARVGRALAAQTRPPDTWLVVDDASTDETLGRLAALQRELSFLEVRSAPQRRDASEARERLLVAAEAQAFAWGLETVDLADYTHVGKLDGDVELPPDYLERLLAEFRRDPALGVAGGLRKERQGSGWQLEQIPRYHVPGGLKLYSRRCLHAIGGVQGTLGWDTIDETYARMQGFRTWSFPDLVAIHHRPWGSADGRLRGYARAAQCAYVVHYPLTWVALRSLKVAVQGRPPVLAGLAFLWGYIRAAMSAAPKVEDREFRRFVRGELRERMLRPLRRPRARESA